ncbi:hypothetical protein GOV04_05620 [Candidatus Woesearchaeota archaeon]|nr:hypothetical protein [Candidatus Woesearchaeota archaeon]
MRFKTLFFIIVLMCTVVYADTFNVGMQIPPAWTNQTMPNQTTPVIVGGPNITILLPLVYNIQNPVNISIPKPPKWPNGFSWQVIENNTPVTVTQNSTHLSWSADNGKTPSFLKFNVSSPTLNITSIRTTSSYFEKNMTVHAQNPFINVSVVVNSSENHTAYYLYWFDGINFVDRTSEYNLQIVNNTVNFNNFNTSDQYFSLQGYCVESWSCTAWSQSTCGTRTCTDSNNCGTQILKPTESITCITGDGGGGDGGGGGMGGGTSNTTSSQELVLPSKITITTFEGLTIEHPITFLIDRDLTISLSIIDNQIISLQESTIEVKTNISKQTNLLINGAILGVHLYDLTVEYDNVQHSIPLTITVQEKPFDFFVSENEINFGEPLGLNIKMLADLPKQDIILYLKEQKRIIKIVPAQSQTIDLYINAGGNEQEVCADLYFQDATFTECQNITVLNAPQVEQTSNVQEGEKSLFSKILKLFVIIIMISGLLGVIILLIVKYAPKKPKSIQERAKEIEELTNKLNKM